MNTEKIHNEITHLKAQIYLQQAEIQAALSLLKIFSQQLHNHLDLSPHSEDELTALVSSADKNDELDFYGSFLRLRKAYAQKALENLEDNKPQLAAVISEILGDPSREFPI